MAQMIQFKQWHVLNWKAPFKSIITKLSVINKKFYPDYLKIMPQSLKKKLIASFVLKHFQNSWFPQFKELFYYLTALCFRKKIF